MPRHAAPIILCVILISCKDTGIESVDMNVEPALGPYANTDKTVYGIGEPLTVTIGSDTSTISVEECGDELSFYLDFLLLNAWTEWSDNATSCLESGSPSRIYTIGPDNVYAQAIVPPSTYPGTYRLRIPYHLTGREKGELVTNEFSIKE